MTDASVTDRRFTVAYGLAHGGKSLFWHASELFFAYFLSEACGLPPGQMGVVLGGSLALAAFSDLLTGTALGGSVRRAAQAGSVQLIGAWLSAIAFVAFALTSLAPQGGLRLAAAICGLVVFRVSYSLVDNPQNAILGLAAQTDTARARLSSVRYIFGGAANILVASAFVPLFKVGPARDQAGHFIVFAGLVGLIAGGLSTGLWIVLRRQERRLPSPQDRTASAPRGSASATRLGPVLAIMFLITAAMSVFSHLEPYFASYGMPTALQGGGLMTGVAVGTMVSQPLWSMLAQRTSLRTAMATACLVMAVGSAAFAGLASRGLVLSLLGAVLYGSGSGGVLMSLWALTASASAGRATLSFGALTCVSKLALSISALATGSLLNEVDYRAMRAAQDWILPTMTSATGVASLAALAAVLAMSRPAKPVAPAQPDSIGLGA